MSKLLKTIKIPQKSTLFCIVSLITVAVSMLVLFLIVKQQIKGAESIEPDAWYFMPSFVAIGFALFSAVTFLVFLGLSLFKKTRHPFLYTLVMVVFTLLFSSMHVIFGEIASFSIMAIVIIAAAIIGVILYRKDKKEPGSVKILLSRLDKQFGSEKVVEGEEL